MLTNKPVQMDGDEVLTTGYHGYMVTDFTRVDPHLGTNEDLVDLVEAAHSRGMKVFLDVTANHTADVITYAGGRALAGLPDEGDLPVHRRQRGAVRRCPGGRVRRLPRAGPQTPSRTSRSCPPTRREVKVPAWLNDVTMYHNRGDTQVPGRELDVR